MDYNGNRGSINRFLCNFEIRMPIYKIFGLEFFYDGGILNITDKKSNLSWNIGWGITISSALVPARIDFAFKEGKGKSVYQISLLNMF